LAALLAALFAAALLTVFFALSAAPPLLFCCRRSRDGILRCSRAALLDISPVLMSASRRGAAHPEAEFAQSCIETPSHAATVPQRIDFRRARRLAGSLLVESGWRQSAPRCAPKSQPHEAGRLAASDRRRLPLLAPPTRGAAARPGLSRGPCDAASSRAPRARMFVPAAEESWTRPLSTRAHRHASDARNGKSPVPDPLAAPAPRASLCGRSRVRLPVVSDCPLNTFNLYRPPPIYALHFQTSGHRALAGLF